MKQYTLQSGAFISVEDALANRNVLEFKKGIYDLTCEDIWISDLCWCWTVCKEQLPQYLRYDTFDIYKFIKLICIYLPKTDEYKWYDCSEVGSVWEYNDVSQQWVVYENLSSYEEYHPTHVSTGCFHLVQE